MASSADMGLSPPLSVRRILFREKWGVCRGRREKEEEKKNYVRWSRKKRKPRCLFSLSLSQKTVFSLG